MKSDVVVTGTKSTVVHTQRCRAVKRANETRTVPRNVYPTRKICGLCKARECDAEPDARSVTRCAVCGSVRSESGECEFCRKFAVVLGE